ncbi:MAG TPA: ATP-binding protein [Verrucomicrobiae bacterium]|nr:ATP-binding protein [Verrucomicrobiae bacterium]
MNRASHSRRFWPVLALAAAFLVRPAAAQRGSDWRSFKMADGLPESACASITFSPQGKVLVRHLAEPLLSVLDGYSVKVLAAPRFGKGRVYQSPGGQLWSVSSEGLEEFSDGAWQVHPLPELPGGPFGPRLPSETEPAPLFVVRQGQVLVLLQDRLVEYKAESPQPQRAVVLRLAAQTGLGGFFGMTIARDGGLWISGEHGLARVPGPARTLLPDTAWREQLLPQDSPVHHLESPHEDADGGVLTLGDSGTNARSVAVYFDGQQWQVLAGAPDKLRQAWPGPDRSKWAMTADALFEWDTNGRELTQNEEISPRQFLDLALEPGGAFWLATSDGLYRYAPLLWRAPAAARRLTGLVQCLGVGPDNLLCFAAGNEFHILQGSRMDEVPFPAGVGGAWQPRALFLLKNNRLLLAADNAEAGPEERLFQSDFAAGKFVPLTSFPSDGRGEPQPSSSMPPSSMLTRSRLHDSTSKAGLRVLGLLSEGVLCLQNLHPASPTAPAWYSYDGSSLDALPDPPPLSALGTNLDLLFTAHNGELWVAGALGCARWHERKWQLFLGIDPAAPDRVCSFAELPDGHIWAASQDAVWQFDGRYWSAVRRGFDRINQLLRTRDGSLWVASSGGLVRFINDAWIENGLEEGLPGPAVRQLLEDARGQLWAGTSRGLSSFHPDADTEPPQTTIAPLSDTGDSLSPSTMLSVSWTGIDKWKYTPRDRLLYSYRRDELDWSSFQEFNHVVLPDLLPGKHVFQIRAMDRNGNIESKVQREFSIVLPWYKESRLLFIASLGGALALFFASLAFNGHRRLVRSYTEVERKVAERTRQLEIANRELVQSQKMTALGTLAAGIAHDFNNILSIIKGSAQIIEENLDDPGKIRLRADRIKMVVEQGAGIVKAMLGFSRDSGQAPEPCDLNDLVRDTLKLLGDRFLREIQIRFQPAPGLPPIVLSRDFVQQILLNFLFNAAEAKSRNRQVLLSTARLEKLPADLVLIPSATECLAVLVQDFGCGISPEILPRIFEPFFTTKALSARRGTGLGLSMVYELARRMGAGLAVQTVVAQGSTFTLLLPLTPPTTDPGPDVAGSQTSPLTM